MQTVRRYALPLLSAIILAAAGLSCSKDGPSEDREAIRLQTGVDWQTTKGTYIDGADASARAAVFESTYGTEGIGVLAYTSSTGDWANKASYFHNAKFTCTTSHLWESNPLYWWPDAKTRFFAYAPYGGSGIDVSAESDSDIPYLTYTVPSDIASQSEILISDTGSFNYEGRPGSKSMTFGHALCIVRFVLSEDSRSGDVSNLTLSGVKSEGTLPLDSFNGATSTWKSTTWTNLSGSESYTNAGPSGPYVHHFGTAKNMYDTEDGSGCLILIPQPTTGLSVKLEFKTKESESPKTYSAGLAGTTWLPGRIYTYTLTVTESMKYTLSVENLDPVGPDVLFSPGLGDWTDENSSNKDLGDNDDYVLYD